MNNFKVVEFIFKEKIIKRKTINISQGFNIFYSVEFEINNNIII